MAGSNSQKQLLNLIRDFRNEKSQGERRVVSQKKLIEELKSELETATAELERAKRDKENTEQELKGYEVELSMNDASIETLKARISLSKNEITKLGSEIAAIKNEENCLRDGFIEKMLELNSQIRKFQDLLASSFNAENRFEAPRDKDHQITEKSSGGLEHELAQLICHTNQAEEQYKCEQVIHDQIQQELINLEKKALLLELVMKASLELQELGRQTSELENQCASLGEELQKRFICPRCKQDNSEELGKILQMATEGS